MIDAHVHLEKGDYTDAHSPQNVGLCIKEMNDLIKNHQITIEICKEKIL